MATPFLNDLHQTYPQAEIALLIRKPFKKVLQHFPHCQEFYDWPQGVRQTLKWLKQMRQQKKFDLGILLTNSFSSAFLFFLLRIPERLGYARDGRSFLLTQKIAPPKKDGKILPSSMVDYYQSLLIPLHGKIGPRRVVLYYTDSESKEAELYLQKLGLQKEQPYLLLNPGAAFGSAKCWPADYFAKVGDQLIQAFSFPVIILCGPAPEERALAKTIQSKMQQKAISTHDQIIDLTLLKPILSWAKLLITNDSGPRHYAAAFQVPTITLFGSTHQEWTEYEQKDSIALQKKVPCGPCMQRSCPEVRQGRTHQCMEKITPEEVFLVAKEWLQKKVLP